MTPPTKKNKFPSLKDYLAEGKSADAAYKKNPKFVNSPGVPEVEDSEARGKKKETSSSAESQGKLELENKRITVKKAMRGEAPKTSKNKKAVRAAIDKSPSKQKKVPLDVAADVYEGKPEPKKTFNYGNEKNALKRDKQEVHEVSTVKAVDAVRGALRKGKAKQAKRFAAYAHGSAKGDKIARRPESDASRRLGTGFRKIEKKEQAHFEGARSLIPLKRVAEGLQRDIRRGEATRLPPGQYGWGHVQTHTPKARFKQRFRQLRAMNPKMNQRNRETAVGIAAAPGYMGNKRLASNARTDTAWVPNSRTPDSKIPPRGRRRGETWDPSEMRPSDWGASRQFPAEKRKSLGEGSRGLKRLKRVADAKEKKYWKALEKGGPKDTSRNPNVTVDKREKEMNMAYSKERQKEKEGDARAVKNLSKTKNIKGALNLKGNKHRMDRRRSMHEEMTSTALSARMRSKTPEGDYVKGGKQPGSKKARRKSDLKATLSKDVPTQKGVWKGGKKAAERERHVQSVAAHVRATGKAPRRRIPQSPEEEK